MGTPVRRLLRARLRTVLIVSGAAVAVLAAGAFALANAGGSTGSARAALTAPPPDDPLADRPHAEPTRANRGAPRSPEPAPEKSPEKTAKKPRKADVAAARLPEPERKKAKRRGKVVGSGSCEASYYWQGQMTASGERFDPGELTAAHKTLPMGSRVRVTNENNGRSVTVRINDRGPFVAGRCLDLSRAAMRKVGGTGSGVVPVRYEVLARG